MKTNATLQACAICVVSIGASASAHSQVSLGISTGELRIPGQAAGGALTLAPMIATSAAGLRILSDGQFTVGQTGRTRSALLTSLSTRRTGALGLAPLIVIRGQDDPWATTTRNRRLDGAVGAQIGSEQFSASATIGVARSTHGSTSRSVQTSQADLRLSRGAFRFSVGYAGNAFDAAGEMPATNRASSITRTRLADITSEGSWRSRRVELGGFLGRRVVGAEAHTARWGGAYASVAVTDRLAIIARQETSVADPTRHLAAQRLSTIGFRIRPTLSRARFDDGSDAATHRREFVMTPLRGGARSIRIYRPDAAIVELAASFTQWAPTRMQSLGGGWWELVVALAPGLHSLNIRADGGRWAVPPGLESTDDEFNGMVGVLLIPEPR